MPKTISFHNGTAWSRGHNIRDERYTSKQEHIDTSLTANNVTICDMPVRQAYEEIFGQAVQEYNNRQKRADRKIECYYDKIKHDKRKHPVYECIVQIGDKDDTGNSAELEKQALIRFAEEWSQRNPNLYLVGAYIHADEPNGTVHLHCDYIPVAECSKGMKIQNSYDKALQQQGFKSENIHQTAQIAWQEREREALTAICRDLNIDAQHSQGIGKGRKYLTPQEYRRAKSEQQAQIDEELQSLKEELDEYKQLKVSGKDFLVDEKKVLFSKDRVSVAKEDLEKLKEQAKAYRINQPKIISLKKQKETLDTKKQELDYREEVLRQGELDLAGKNAEWVEDFRQLCQDKDKHRKIYQLLEQAERKISILENENCSLKNNNSSLTAQIAEKEKNIKQLLEQAAEIQETLRGAYESLTSVTKAIGMLKYDKGKYKVAGLSEEQSKLIDAIANYGAYWAEQDGFSDFAKTMQEKIGISEGIQDFIDKLASKKSRGGMRL